jgi:transposase InsO family protein
MILVAKWAAKYGVNRTLAVLGLSKGSWHYRQTGRCLLTEKYAALRSPLLKIAHDHPFYGYRKVTCELRETYGKAVNTKVVRKLQKAWELPLIRAVHPPKPSAIRRVLQQLGDRINLVATLESIRALQVLYTDFTELIFDRQRQKAQLMPLVDHASKYVVGWAVASAKNTSLALAAWTRARRNLQHFGIHLATVIVHHDQDTVYTAHEWLRHVRLLDKVRISYALNGARDNTEMESFNGHFKAENASILWEQRDLAGVIRVVERRMLYYNDIRRHASLENVSPAQFLRQHGFQPR